MAAVDEVPATASLAVDTPAPINLSRLSYFELTQLLQSALQKHPDIGPSISEAIARIDARELAESLKPPPAVNYNSLRSSFYKELHSMDRLKSSHKFSHAHRLAEPLQEFICEVSDSVNKNSPRETVEEAFVCLQKFIGQLEHLDHYVEEQLISEAINLRSDVCRHMHFVAKLLKEKGGTENLELQQKIKEYAKSYDDGKYMDFKDVYNTLWGEDDELVSIHSEDDEGNFTKRARYQ